MKVTEFRELDSYTLRNLCIDNNWYTSGDNESYSAMLSKCDKDNITTEDIVSIAQDIMKHTDLAPYRETITDTQILALFCYLIAGQCESTFQVE